jgi:uncharacterized protein (DUF305 family)
MHKIRTLLPVAALLIAGAAAFAQDDHDHSAMSETRLPPASAAYAQINADMHKAMDIEFTGDADADFIRAMIPHHQGAVEMAKVVLQHGRDPEVRELAAAVIKAQEAEIAWMQEWLAARGK